MKRITLSLLFFFAITISFAQNEYWKQVEETTGVFAKQELETRKSIPSKYKLYNLDFDGLKLNLEAKSKGKINTTISLPTRNGIESFTFKEASSFSKELSKKFPSIKSYVATGIKNTSLTARFSIGNDGFHLVIFEAGKSTIYIDPYTKDKRTYVFYDRNNLSKSDNDFRCELETSIEKNKIENISARNANDGVLRTFRLAIVCSGEYAQFHLNDQNVPPTATDQDKKAAVLSAMNTSMTRINGVYEKDLGVRMEIVANNDDIIFLDPNTDGITDGSPNTMLNEGQAIFDNVIGNANYDIGHIFSIAGAGLAGLGVVCLTGQKGRGVTGIGTPKGDPYDIDYVSHEIGHQFGATHTFNNFCDGNRTSSTAFEPGSGSTIMAYAGICGPNVQGVSDDYFHSASIEQMWNRIQNTANCAVITNINNNTPTANAGPDYAIPSSTPFVLRGQGSDADVGNILTYNWEQKDNEIGSMPPVSTNTVGPMFRSLNSSISSDRYMPALSTVISGNTSSTWEVIPSVAREMNFRLTVRDNNSGGGNSASDNMKVTVVNSDPFVVSSPNTAFAWDVGSTQTVTWVVGSTNVSPIDCQNVNIKLSTDGGLTYGETIVSNTENDGSYTFIVPNNVTTSARIMVEAADNIFYDISNENFTINSTTPTFLLANNSGIQEACNVGGGSANYTIAFDFVNGFSENVVLSASGLPAGATATFNPSTINSDGNVIMTIDNLNGATAQEYDIDITGTSTTVTQTLGIKFKVFSDAFSTVTLSSPASNASGIELKPTFVWSADANASSYDIKIATDPNFANVILLDNLPTNTYTFTTSLNGTTEYFWEVRPKNDCGVGNYSTSNSFTTLDPVYCAALFPISTNSEWISNVTFNNINNNSGNDHDPTADDGYEDFTSVSTDITRDATYQISVTLNTVGYQDHIYVFIDWNQDFEFDIATERYDLGTEFDDNGDFDSNNNPITTNFDTTNFDIKVPSDAILGETRMRVIIEYTDNNTSHGDGPCTDNFNWGYGETEDYTVNIKDNPASIDDVSFEGFNLFPNPTKGDFNLRFDVVNTNKVSVQLFDIRGRLVGEKNYFDTPSTFSETISFDNTSAGLYLLKITNGNIQTTRRLIIE